MNIKGKLLSWWHTSTSGERQAEVYVGETIMFFGGFSLVTAGTYMAFGPVLGGIAMVLFGFTAMVESLREIYSRMWREELAAKGADVSTEAEEREEDANASS